MAIGPFVATTYVSMAATCPPTCPFFKLVAAAAEDLRMIVQNGVTHGIEEVGVYLLKSF